MGRSAALAALRAAAPVVPPAFPVPAALNLAEPYALLLSRARCARGVRGFAALRAAMGVRSAGKQEAEDGDQDRCQDTQSTPHQAHFGLQRVHPGGPIHPVSCRGRLRVP